MAAQTENAVQTQDEVKPQRRGFFLSRRLLSGVIAVAVISAAVAAAHHYGFGFRHDKFREGLAALDRGDWVLARRYARELKASQPSSPQGSFLQGAMLLEKGYFYPALDELGEAKGEVSLKAAALTLTGQAWHRLGRHVEAHAALLEALKEDPDSVDAHRWLAASYYDLGVIGEAVRYLERTAELDPSDPRPHRLLGLIHKDFSRFNEAIPFYQESLRRKSDQPDADKIRQELASCQVEHRRYSDALETLAKCSDLPQFEVLRAECYHAQGNVADAKAALDRALKVKSDNLDGLLLRGTMLLEEGHAQEAIEALQRAVKTHRKDYEAHFKLSEAYGKAGQQRLSDAERKEAENIRFIREEFSTLHKEASERPGDMQVRLRLANLAKELDRPDLAEVWRHSAAAVQSFSKLDGN